MVIPQLSDNQSNTNPKKGGMYLILKGFQLCLLIFIVFFSALSAEKIIVNPQRSLRLERSGR
jgi:hypothetical protein